jgi:hypothetical protein
MGSESSVHADGERLCLRNAFLSVSIRVHPWFQLLLLNSDLSPGLSPLAAMSRLSWYWHRLRAMSPVEMALHVRKKLRQRADARRLPDWSALNLEPIEAFPRLPRPEDAPPVVREALQRDVEDILAGRLKAFGHLDLKVDDPPKWHCDYLVGKDFATTESAFKLNHRVLPGGADVKLIWELSRWYQLVRLAMAAYVLGDTRAARKCVEWLEDWVKHNPPYRGWNWTSALEAGLRLIQFTWIDALLGAPSSSSARADDTNAPSRSSALQSRLAALRGAILPPHVWYAWRHRSFGSSANNHLLGELAGCIVATVRWPELARCGAPLDELQRRWEHEVLAQFAADGGNKEQALNYQLFSWELCWQAFTALYDRKSVVSQVELRLASAAHFFREVQIEADHWDYGDSDNAFVVPYFARADRAVAEWHSWLKGRADNGATAYWLRHVRARHLPIALEFPLNTHSFGWWEVFQDSSIGICEASSWRLRWDLSPLGYGTTAAHGHLDALHLSIWFKGVAFVVDPGTGAYYAEPGLRSWLASRAAHNTPCPTGPEQPRRLGPFLWAGHHRPPSVSQERGETVGVLSLIGQLIRRAIEPLPDGAGWIVKDECIGKDGRPIEFTVRWQFAPETSVKRLDERLFLIRRNDVAIGLQVSEGWSDVVLVEMDAFDSGAGVSPVSAGVPPASAFAGETPAVTAGTAAPLGLEGIVSPAFRKTVRAPYLKLVARPTGGPCVFSTTFLAWPRA